MIFYIQNNQCFMIVSFIHKEPPKVFVPNFWGHFIQQLKANSQHGYISFFIKFIFSYGGYFIAKSILFDDFKTARLLLNAIKLS